jgi:hypothetical protein
MLSLEERDQLMKLRREITFETEKIVIRGELPEFNWCDACAALTPKITAEQAAILTGEDADQIHRRAGQGQVHSTRTSGGVLKICMKSLSARSNRIS